MVALRVHCWRSKLSLNLILICLTLILGKTPVDRMRGPFTVGTHNLLSMKPSLSLLPLTAALLLVNGFAVSSLASSPPPIPLNQLGAVAGKQYQGDGLSVRATATGAELRCAFQRLAGEVTAEGLWLRSTAVEADGERFRVLATGVGRDRECAAGSCCGSADWQSAVSRIGNPQAAPGWSVQPTASRRHSRLPTCATAERPVAMPAMGRVETSENVTRFIRPGLTEEYSVSVDGVRQDFLIAQPPVGGTGELRLELDVTGATVAPLGNGVQLTLPGSGRQLAYHRLHVTDATGRELPARMEVAAGILPDVEGAHPAARIVAAKHPSANLLVTSESAGLEAPALRQAEMPAATKLAVLVDDANAVYPVRIDPTFSDADWISMGGLRGANNSVFATAVDAAGDLYIGGSFTAVGEVIANGIAKWDGNAWSVLGSGFSNGVTALATSGNVLYAGVNNYVAKWDGIAWSVLGSGMTGGGGPFNFVFVKALAVAGTNLYAGGAFTMADGTAANNIAKWDGTAWSALGSGVDSWVYALAVSDTNLYAGGFFATAGGIPANRIGKWDGIAWSALGSGMVGSVHALAVSGNDVYAGGDFTTTDGTAASNIAKWNGSVWSALGSGMNSEVATLV
jgi:hypothetical protein